MSVQLQSPQHVQRQHQITCVHSFSVSGVMHLAVNPKSRLCYSEVEPDSDFGKKTVVCAMLFIVHVLKFIRVIVLQVHAIRTQC